MLDVRTLFVCILVAQTAMAICLAVALGARFDTSRWPGLRAWTAGMALQVLGWVIRLAPTGLPEMFSVALGLAVVSLGFGFFWRGARQLAGQSSPVLVSTLPAAVIFVQQLVLFEHFLARAVFVNLVFAVQYASLIAPILTCRQGIGSGTRALFILAAGVGAASIAARAFLLLYDPTAIAGLLVPHPVNSGALLATHVSGLVLVFAMMGMYMQRSDAANRRLANTDPLTGTLNRRSLERIAGKEAARAEAGGQPVSVIMFDIDHFKGVNDRFGHSTGDAVLQRVAGEVQQALRANDAIARVGGEEFCVTLPGVAAAQACEVGERIRRRVEALAWDEGELHVTVSIGIAERQAGELDLWSAIKRADARLYAAKANGRNCVCSAEPLPAPG